MPLNIAQSVGPVPQLASPADLYQQGLTLRGLGQQNQQREIALPFEQQRLQQEGQQRQQGIDAFPVTRDAAKLKNEEMANELAETFISQKAKEIKKLPQEQRAEAAKGLTDWLTKRQQMYPDYAHIYDASHFKDSKWDDEELTNLERINLSPDERYKLENPASPEKPSEVKEYEYYAEQEKGAGRNPKDYQAWRLEGKKAGATSNNITVKTGEELGKQVAKHFADEVSTLNTEAEAAAQSIPAIRKSIQLVDQGIVAGTGADLRLTLAKALATATGTPDEEVNNTDQFVANTANLVAQNIKNFGAGTGLSDADREYAQKMAGGSTQMTPQAIKRILQINEKMQKAKVDRYNKRRGKLLEQNPELGGYYDEIKVEDAPQSPLAQLPTVKTQKEFDALPKGSQFWEDGKLMRKP